MTDPPARPPPRGRPRPAPLVPGRPRRGAPGRGRGRVHRPGARAAARALAAGLGGTAVEEEDPHAFRVRGTRLGDLAVELDLRHAHPRAHADTLPFRLGPRAAAWLGSALGPSSRASWSPRPCPRPGSRRSTRPWTCCAARARGAAGRPGPARSACTSTSTRPASTPRRWPPSSRPSCCSSRGCGARPWGTPRRWAARLPAGAVPGRLRPPGARAGLPAGPGGPGRGLPGREPDPDRGLDLLPVLLHLDPARVRAALPREKVGARPALHYRLPRARVGEAGLGDSAGLGRLGGGGAAGGRPRPAGGARRAHPGQGRAAGGGRGARAQARPRPGPPADPADHRRGDAPSPAPAFIAREDRKAGPRRGPPWADHRAATSSNERSRAAWS
jgi:hypothetical protein